MKFFLPLLASLALLSACSSTTTGSAQVSPAPNVTGGGGSGGGPNQPVIPKVTDLYAIGYDENSVPVMFKN